MRTNPPQTVKWYIREASRIKAKMYPTNRFQLLIFITIPVNVFTNLMFGKSGILPGWIGRYFYPSEMPWQLFIRNGPVPVT